MGRIHMPDGSVYVADADRAAGSGAQQVSKGARPVSKAEQDARIELVLKAKEYRRAAENTNDFEVRDYYTRLAKEIEETL